MYKERHIIAVIPARGGSRRLPRKNILPIGDNPLIAWSIKSALECQYIDRCIVSTDDEEIAEISKDAGAEVLMRPEELATDTAPTLPVIQDVVKRIETHADFIVLLQPTSPFRDPEGISEAIAKLIDTEADALLGVSKCKMPPEWLLQVKDEYLKLPDYNDLSKTRSQDHQEWFRINGALYIYSRETLMNAEKYAFGEKTLPFLIESPYDIDIDTEEDFKIAEGICHAYDFYW